MKKLIILFLLAFPCAEIAAQAPLPKYPLVFEGPQQAGDTSLTHLQLKSWAAGNHFPAILKWKNTPYELKENAHVLALCTDSLSHYNNNDIIGYAYFKISSSGSFRFDYKLSNIGRYVNDGASPNVDLVLTSQGVLMKANGYIAPGTALTVDYDDLVNMFPGDPTVEFINY
ncbi:MAG: hypothetical protein JWO09_2744 [Bacteroidetes bacterium]|nr:hypothetical protein [Bacteroidota bacterium]